MTLRRLKNPARPWLSGDETSIVPPAVSGSPALTNATLTSGVLRRAVGGFLQPTMLSQTTPAGWSTLEQPTGPGTNWLSEFWRALNQTLLAGRAYNSFNESGPSSSGVLVTPIWGVSVGPARKVLRYGLTPTIVGRQPASWELQGANSSAGPWITLDARADLSTGWADSTERLFTVASPGVYTHYRLYITKATPSATYVDIYNLRIWYEENSWQAISAANPSSNLPALTSPPSQMLFVATALDETIDPALTTFSVSRDNGTTYSAVTDLAASKDLGAGVVLYKGLVDVSGQPSGTQLRVKLASSQGLLGVSGFAAYPLAA